MEIQPRRAASLPPVPSSVGHRSLSSWAGIKVHHTGGAFSSWRAIHDWQTAGRPPGDRLVYIGYSFGIANGTVTELRGFDHHPAHDHENGTLGVVFGGNYTSRLPPAEDLDAFVEFVRYAREHTGRPLPVDGHRDTWPRGDHRYSSCPGDRLYGHLPQLRQLIDEEDDMPTVEEIWEDHGIDISPTRRRRPSTALGLATKYAGRAAKLGAEAVAGQQAILAAVQGQDAAQAAADAARAAVREELAGVAGDLAEQLAVHLPGLTEEQIRAATEAAVRGVLGGLDEDDEAGA